MRIALPAAIAADALADHDPHADIVSIAGETMGTTWHVKFVGRHGVDPSAIQRPIVAKLADLVGQMSHWEPDSLLSRFNRAPAGTWLTLPADFAAVVTAGLAIAAQSDGAFDPAIGTLVDLWSFGPIPLPVPPSENALAMARQNSGWARLTFDPATARLRQPGGLALDLSGIAKGRAVDALVTLLGNQGIGHCLVEIGGELAGRGIRPDRDPWWVDLENPPGIALPPLRIALHGLAVATSGDYRRGGHTIDPRSGRPVANVVVSASVIHAEAMVADAWATAFTVAGGEPAMLLGAHCGIAARIVTIENGRAVERLTPALAAMLAD